MSLPPEESLQPTVQWEPSTTTVPLAILGLAGSYSAYYFKKQLKLRPFQVCPSSFVACTVPQTRSLPTKGHYGPTYCPFANH
jgi:hypothetical protein